MSQILYAEQFSVILHIKLALRAMNFYFGFKGRKWSFIDSRLITLLNYKAHFMLIRGLSTDTDYVK